MLILQPLVRLVVLGGTIVMGDRVGEGGLSFRRIMDVRDEVSMVAEGVVLLLVSRGWG
jgi:hypothetical protein